MADTFDELLAEVEQDLLDPLDGPTNAGRRIAAFVGNPNLTEADRQRVVSEIAPRVMRGSSAEVWRGNIARAVKSEPERALRLLEKYATDPEVDDEVLLGQARALFDESADPAACRDRLLQLLQTRTTARARDVEAYIVSWDGHGESAVGGSEAGVGSRSQNGNGASPNHEPGSGYGATAGQADGDQGEAEDGGEPPDDEGERGYRAGLNAYFQEKDNDQAAHFFRLVPAGHRRYVQARYYLHLIQTNLPPTAREILSRIGHTPQSVAQLAIAPGMAQYAREMLDDINRLFSLASEAVLGDDWKTTRDWVSKAVAAWAVYEPAEDNYFQGRFEESLKGLNTILGTAQGGGMFPTFPPASFLKVAADDAQRICSDGEALADSVSLTSSDWPTLGQAHAHLGTLPKDIKQCQRVLSLERGLRAKALAICKQEVAGATAVRAKAEDSRQLDARVTLYREAQRVLDSVECLDWESSNSGRSIEVQLVSGQLARLEPLLDRLKAAISEVPLQELMGSDVALPGTPTPFAIVNQWAELLSQLKVEFPADPQVLMLAQKGADACVNHQSEILSAKRLRDAPIAMADGWYQLARKFVSANDPRLADMTTALQSARRHMQVGHVLTWSRWIGIPVLGVVLAVFVVSNFAPAKTFVVNGWRQTCLRFGLCQRELVSAAQPTNRGPYVNGHNVNNDGQKTWETAWTACASVCGPPLTEAEQWLDRDVQVFQNIILEYQPENITNAKDFVVQGRSIGYDLVELPGSDAIDHSVMQTNSTCSSGSQFVQVPKRDGGFCVLQQFVDFPAKAKIDRLHYIGYPITSVYRRGNVQVQWFEKARLEIDTNSSNPEVRMGPVGLEYLCAPTLMNRRPPSGCP